jgi:biotin carboxylase
MSATGNGNGSVVLVVGSGGQLYREYLLASAAQRHPVWLLDAAEPTWQQPYAVGTSVVGLLDRARLIPDTPRLVKAAERVAAQRHVAGVLTYDETLVTTAAQIAERLGLPGLTVDGADRCRNKQRSRDTLSAAGIRQPRFAVAYGFEDAVAAARTAGYPVVLKPRGMGASIGVVRAESPGELPASFAIAERASHGGSPDYEGGVLVEEMLCGPEISIDGAVLADGSYRPFFLARKRIGHEPSFEEVGHTVSAGDRLLDDPALLEMLEAAHRELGLGCGITHTEVILTAAGPVIVEVNARLGGDLIPYLGKLATGIDPAHVAVALATGGPPPLQATRRRCVGIRFLYPPADCVVDAITLPSEGPGLLGARAMAQRGATLRLPPRAHLGRYAYVVCEGRDAAECDARLYSAAVLTTLESSPAA